MQLRKGVILVLLLGTTALTGCDSSDGIDGVATANGTAKPRSTAAKGPVDAKERALTFASCMRDNGVPNFPDPTFNDDGGMNLYAPEGVSPAEVDAAMQKCKQYMPDGGEPQRVDPERLEQLRKMAQCMREHGVRNFPDPTENGLEIDGNLPGMDPKDRTFQAAQKECDKCLPPPAGGSPAAGNRSNG